MNYVSFSSTTANALKQTSSISLRFSRLRKADKSERGDNMNCGECKYSARVDNGQNIDSSRYTYCSRRTHKTNNKVKWTKVCKNSDPKWCPLKSEKIVD